MVRGEGSAPPRSCWRSLKFFSLRPWYRAQLPRGSQKNGAREVLSFVLCSQTAGLARGSSRLNAAAIAAKSMGSGRRNKVADSAQAGRDIEEGQHASQGRSRQNSHAAATSSAAERPGREGKRRVIFASSNRGPPPNEETGALEAARDSGDSSSDERPKRGAAEDSGHAPRISRRGYSMSRVESVARNMAPDALFGEVRSRSVCARC